MRKKYRLFIKETNLKINIDGEICKHGFFTTRFIEADDELKAKQIVTDLIEAEIAQILLNDANDPPKFFFEHILEIESFEAHDVPGFGFTWFKE